MAQSGTAFRHCQDSRWLGGTLTNFSTIQGRIDHLVRLEDALERGEFGRMAKKEVLKIEEEIIRLNRHFGGIKELTKLPAAVFIVDPVRIPQSTTITCLSFTVRGGRPRRLRSSR